VSRADTELTASIFPKPSVPAPLSTYSLVARSVICEVTARVFAEEFGSRLCSAVLTGSLARGEASFVKEGDLSKSLGDAEFLLILHQHAPLPSSLALLRARSESAILERGIECHVSLSATHADYLLKMRPHIFGYELRTCGAVVLGDPTVLSLIPAFSPSDIPLEDGWRLLCNRMIELLEMTSRGKPERASASKSGELGHLSSPGCDPSPLTYSVAKVYLDMATSFLLFVGAYVPTYRGREARLRTLAKEVTSHNGRPPLPLARLSRRVTACTEFKLGTGNLHADDLSGEWPFVGTIPWEELCADVHTLWRWELAHLIRAADAAGRKEIAEEPQRATIGMSNTYTDFDDLNDLELMRKWMQLQPMKRRLRGWAYTLRKCGWHRSWRSWPRWIRLAWQASPRYQVYAAASQIFFKLGGLVARGEGSGGSSDLDEQELRSRLPLSAGGWDRQSGSICNASASHSPLSTPASAGSWQTLAQEIACNYHAFLEGTQA